MAESVAIPSTMKGVYLPGDRRCEIRATAIPQPGPDQVLVQTRASALCGSDLRSIYRPKVHKTGAEGYLGVIAGHEPCGVIVKRGEGVLDAWKEGTRVVVYHIQGCGSCHQCRMGLYISCEAPERKAYGWQRNGGHGEYILVDVQSLVRLPEPLTYLDGSIIACGLGTAYAACSRAQVSGRDRVLITGLGPVGLGAALLAQRMGAKVLGIEFDSERVAFARKIGIESFECVKGQSDEDGDVKAAVAWSDGQGVDVAIDCSGAASARLTGLKAARSWGRVVFVGEGGGVAFDVSNVVIHKSLSVYGSWVCSIGQMEELVERLVWWDLHPEITVTHTFSIDEAERAYEIFDSGKTGKCAILYQAEKQKYRVEPL
ncbi:oxidoreductase [Phellopilus nigrolimitatus]|nr:oxidoreductase [Phellopilus nigrolimitatus]